jgi:transcriptional regulator with XRE-family HTH domain
MSDRDYARVGARIRREREAAGYTQASLAPLAGIDNTTLSKIESGKRGLDSLVLRRIARALDVPMDRFFAADDIGEPLVLGRDASGNGMDGMVAWARKMKADIAFIREAARRYE